MSVSFSDLYQQLQAQYVELSLKKVINNGLSVEESAFFSFFVSKCKCANPPTLLELQQANTLLQLAKK